MAVPGADGHDVSDLSAPALKEALGARPFRTYPALLSTEADAMAWGRSGGPHGGVVVAGYQASPRGRGGVPWTVPATGAIACSVLLRPGVGIEGEGWLYPVGVAALGDIRSGRWSWSWPDELRAEGDVVGRVGLYCAPAKATVQWAVLNLMATGVVGPRGPVLAQLLGSLDVRLGQPADELVAELHPRCTTIGRGVRVRLVPMGPRGIVIEGTATEIDEHGSLVVNTAGDRRHSVRPQDVGLVDVS